MKSWMKRLQMGNFVCDILQTEQFCTLCRELALLFREYQRLFDRKLPVNILVSTYYTPMTIRQLTIELGVPMAVL